MILHSLSPHQILNISRCHTTLPRRNILQIPAIYYINLLSFLIITPMYQEHSNASIDQFMAITGCQGSEAQYYLNLHHNNLQSALQDFYEDPTKAHKNLKKTTLLKAYKEFRSKGDNRNCIVRSIDVTGRKLIEDVRILWKEMVPSVIRGATPGEEFLMEVGGQVKNLHFQEGTFDEAIKIAYEVERPLLLLRYTNELKGRLNEIFSEEVKTYVSDRMIVLGLLSSNEQFTKSLKSVNHEHPSLLVFRTNFINEVQLMSECDIKPQTTPADILSFLKRSIDSVNQEQVLESDIKREVTFEQEYHDVDHQDPHENVLMEPEESGEALERDYELEREIKRIQEEEFREMKQQHERKKSEQLEEILQGKRNQEKLEMMQEDRKARKLSLPQEPTVGSIITFNFKLPMGGRLLRSFDKGDKIELIYNYIDLEDIEFQNELQRKFDLLTMNPSTSLSSRKDQTIEEVFGDERQEVLLIKEL